MIGAQKTMPLLGLLALGACTVVPPSAPDVMALPAQGKDFATFQREDVNCRAFAQGQTGAPANPNVGVGDAAVGTLAGAAVGAAIGAAAGNPGLGAAVGAGAGLAGGSSIGAANAGATQYSLQQRYDIAYTQCMYAAGNKVTSPPGGAVVASAYPYGYGYGGYPYGYGYGPGFYGPGFVDFGFGFGGYRGYGGGYGRGYGGRGYYR